MIESFQAGTKGITVTAYIVDENGEAVALDGTPVFKFKPPSGALVTVNGTISAGKAVYVLSDGDGVGETAGTWRYQVALDLDSGWDGNASIAQFEVVANLS